MRSIKYIVLACAPILITTAHAHAAASASNAVEAASVSEPLYPDYDDYPDFPPLPSELPSIDDVTDDVTDDIDGGGLTDSVSYYGMDLHFINQTACQISVPEDAMVDQDVRIAVTTNVLGASPSYWLEHFENTPVLNRDTLVFNNISEEESFMIPTELDHQFSGSFKISPLDRASMDTGVHVTRMTLGVDCQ